MRPEGPLDKVEAGCIPVAPPDPRLEAFLELLRALDAPDWRAGILATRKLRALGFSVVLTGPPGGRTGA